MERRNADDVHLDPTLLEDHRRTIANHVNLDKPMPTRINGRRAKLARREDLPPTTRTSLQYQVPRNVRIVRREHSTGTATQAPHARCVPSGARILTLDQQMQVRAQCAHRASGHTNEECPFVLSAQREPFAEPISERMVACNAMPLVARCARSDHRFH